MSLGKRVSTPEPSGTDGARFVRASGYEGCVELSNRTTRVVLEPNLGGRVLNYTLNGEESLYQDPAQAGPVRDDRGNVRHPAAGRFDIGPEYGGLPHEPIWFGRWTAEIAGPRSARLTSVVMPDSGLQLSREFTLAGNSAHLRCTQRIHNHGGRPLRTFHWGRTFLPAGGLVFAPLPPAGRFPRGYCLGGPPGVIDFLPPPDPNVRIRSRVLEILGPLQKAKINLDVEPGWLACLAPSGLLLIKTFPIFPERVYGELASNNASIWYSSPQNFPSWPGRQHVIEMEPIGPLEMIAPGRASSFHEDWWLERGEFPADRKFDLQTLQAAVARANAASSATPNANSDPEPR